MLAPSVEQRKTSRFRLYPTAAQRARLDGHLRLCCELHDAGWSSLIKTLAYKAASAGRVLVKVDPRGTSQHCLCCAHVPKTLSQRWHQCPACGLSAARDHVAAQVVLTRGLRLQDGTRALTPCVS